MEQIYADSIEEARSYYRDFKDIIHGQSHSESVAAAAKEIARSIGFEDFDILELCAFWHDAARTRGLEPHEEAGAVMARDDLLSRGASEEEANRAYEGIRFHKSSANPETVEGKIIRDADKLDIFNVERWKKCAEAGWTKEYIGDLLKTVETRGKYPDAFSYNYTKDQFKKRLPEFLAYYESIKDHLE